MDGNYIKYYINFSDDEINEWVNTVETSSTSWLYNTKGYINHVEYFNTIASPQPNFHNLSFGVFNSKSKLLGGITLYLMSPGEITTGLSGPFYKEYNKKVEKLIFNTLDNIVTENNLSQIRIRISMLADDYIKDKLNENYLSSSVSSSAQIMKIVDSSPSCNFNDYSLQLMITKSLDKEGNRIFQDGDKASLRREVEATILEQIQVAMINAGEKGVDEAKADLKSE